MNDPFVQQLLLAIETTLTEVKVYTHAGLVCSVYVCMSVSCGVCVSGEVFVSGGMYTGEAADCCVWPCVL